MPKVTIPPTIVPSPVRARPGRGRGLAGPVLLAVLTLLTLLAAVPARATERRPGTAPAPSPEAVNAADEVLEGIDVANYQHPNGAAINWQQVRDSGKRFVFVKATEGPITCGGNYYTNSYFKQDWADAGAVGMYRGAYHFARPMFPLGETAIAQARYFVGVTGAMTGAKDLPAVLDFEVTCGLAPADLSTWAHIWLDEVERLTGRKPAITTYASFWSGPMANDTSFGAYPLWFARYGTPSPYPLPASWDDWTWWQTGQGTVPGIVGQVDLNLFNGNEAWLARFAYANSPYPQQPVGKFESVQVAGRDEVVVHGWALDADTQDPIEVDVWVDGALRSTIDADLYRYDVGLFFWIWGPFHGFAPRIDGLGPGPHSICVWANSFGPGHDTDLGCKTVTMPTGPPIGALESVAWRPSGWQIDGWTLDPDTDASLDVALTVDGVVVRTEPAAGARPEIGAYFPDWGAAHGYSFRHWGPPGAHRFCLVARNVGAGADSTLGCRDLVTPGPNPVGGLLLLTINGGSMRIVGWALDPDNGDSLDISITVDGVPVKTQAADIDIPVLGYFFTGFGSKHGFDIATPLAPGSHWVCVTAHNVGTGADTTLGCGEQSG